MVRVLGYHVSRADAHLVACEFIVLFSLYSIAALTASLWLDGSSGRLLDMLLAAVCLCLLISGAMFVMGLDSKAIMSEGDVFVVRLALAVLVSGLAMEAALLYFPSLRGGRVQLPVVLGISFIGMLGVRALFRWIVRSRPSKRRVIIVGTGEIALEIRQLMARVRSMSYELVGYYEPVQSAGHTRYVPESCILDRGTSLIDYLDCHGVDEIIVALTDRRGEMPVEALLEAKLRGVQVMDSVAFCERECSIVRADHLRPSSIAFSMDFQLGAARGFMKRLFDVATSVLLLALTAPVMLFIIMASLIESRGRASVLYFQERTGYAGRPFRLYKFRSMMEDAEQDGKPQWARQDDERVTRLGRYLRRYRLDELPQLFNVLRGDMSLVGPRPERPEIVGDLTASIPFYFARHCVKPGLAGWAQLMYPYGSSVEDARRKLEYDLYYVKHASIILDIVILLRTIEVVVLGKGAR